MDSVRELFIWRAMCRSRCFDYEVNQALLDGRIRCFTYLSPGQESISATVAEAFATYAISRPNVFTQHRNHDILCAFGADMAKVRDELLGLPAGTTGGMGGDPCHHDLYAKYGRIYGHIGLVGDQVPIAVGHAMASKEWVICFLGDSTVEEDVVGPSLGFACTHRLNILFVECDNDLSVITNKVTRRSWSSVEVARAYGCESIEVDDAPENIQRVVDLVLQGPSLGPFYLRVNTTRQYRHVGPGTDGDIPAQYNHFLPDIYERLGDKAREIESRARREMENLWRI